MKHQTGIQLSNSASSAAIENTRHRDLGGMLASKMRVYELFDGSAAGVWGPAALE